VSEPDNPIIYSISFYQFSRNPLFVFLKNISGGFFVLMIERSNEYNTTTIRKSGYRGATYTLLYLSSRFALVELFCPPTETSILLDVLSSYWT
jgi:hypothetical protein